MTGLKTHEKAVKDNVYKMVDMGVKSGFVDKAGREWSMEAYSRTVVQTTSHRTFNDLRLQRMEDFLVCARRTFSRRRVLVPKPSVPRLLY